MIKRISDITFSLLGIIILFPFFIIISLLVVMDSGFPIFYNQKRVGKNGKLFSLLKFRTMLKDSDKKGLLTVGRKDSRITNLGYYLRKLKIDEFPQLFNVLIGDMSLVGPRPEVLKYVELYTEEQKTVLSIRPGITDYASIIYSDENSLLLETKDPEHYYINKVMPSKLKLNLKYIKDQSFSTDLKIILKTLERIIT